MRGCEPSARGTTGRHGSDVCETLLALAQLAGLTGSLTRRCASMVWTKMVSVEGLVRM